MYKIFTLAIAVSLLPVSQKISTTDLSLNNSPAIPAYSFSFKNNINTNLFEPEKKPTEAWSQNWMATAQENISKSEYHFKWEEKLNAYCTPNRKNNLRFFYTDKGFAVEPRTTQIPLGEFDPLKRPDEIKYRLIPNWKINFSLDKKQVSNGKWQMVNNKAEYITDKITVQYINNDEGMRQNFIVHQPLSKNGDLKINFTVKTKLKTVLKNNQLQFFHKKTNLLNYEDLKVWDANNKPLIAYFQKRGKGSYYIQVDTKGAVYPIAIDPISTTPAAIVESNQVNANLGFSVASAGDVNGDGYSDVIVGATGYDSGETDEGAAFIYHGSAAGISTTAATLVQSDQANARMGISVASAGDVNGDGFSDIIVGAMLYDNGETDEGRAFIYHGSATGINNVAVTTVESNQALSQLGYSVACAGDVNGDGYSDVIVGAWLYSNGEGAEGRAFVYHGSASGVNNVAVTTVESNQVNANLGISVAGAGDVNGDGYSDVIAGAQLYDNGTTDEGAAFIYHGSAAGINNVAVTMVESNQGLCQFGFSVSGAGDVNGDGYSDVIVGAYTFDNVEINEGAAFVYHGSAAGINSAVMATIEGNQIAASFGTSVACAGDINGDGYSDVIAGAIQYDNGEANEGAAFVYQGSATGINIIAVAVLESNQANSNMGRGVASAGDVNGDGYSDIVVGAPQYDNPESNEGAAFVYHGSASGIALIRTTLIEPVLPNSGMGQSAATAGDVNGDGFGDLVVGDIGYDNGQGNEGAIFIYHGSANGVSTTYSAMAESNNVNANLGRSVNCAGDVNGDGYSDIIAGAPNYGNGQAGEGAFYVFLGSAAGMVTTPATMVESNQNMAAMGFSVASAGDVNGDGYSDVIVGAYNYTNGQTSEGRAYIYHGSTTGIITPAAAIVESNQVNAGLGFSVSSAGDVNGDGYSDVIIGAASYDNGETDEGVVFVYYGGATGINLATPTILERNVAGMYFGGAVSSAGDVNGDGYADVIVGNQNYTNPQPNEGAIYIFLGSNTGINTTPATFIESNVVSGFFGYRVACAGDVNGDGYSDVIVGAYVYSNPEVNEGACFVYLGGPSGINPVASPQIEGNQASLIFGLSVASAGDLNADGYSDVVVGVGNYAPNGANFIYHGNNPGLNKRNNLRLYNTDLNIPINSSNFLLSNFGAGLYAKSFLGRSKGKMVWETRLNYNAYSGIPITNSTFFTSQQGSYTDMGLAGVELKNIINKITGGGRYTKLRARIKYDPVTAITGQVYSPWRNVSSIIDANNLGALPIELISFNAAWVQKGKTAKLDFKTDKESGICCFDIEKSADGFNFYSIGTLPAKNAAGIKSYSFIDANATSKNQFYRIKIKGIAGQIDYSNMQQLQNDKATEILVFPNPTTDVLQLQLNKVYDKMNVQIINSAGQIVKQLNIPASNQTISIPVQNLAAGKYWLHLKSDKERQVLQFIKQ